MREEYELEVLEKYDIEVRSTRRIRGAFFCDTNKGTMLLKETRISGRRALLLRKVLGCLEERGNIRADTPVFTRDGELLVTSREGNVYMLKKWYYGRECDIRQESETLRAGAQLARLHMELRDADVLRESDNRTGAVNDEAPSDIPADRGTLRAVLGMERDPSEEIRKHNRELKKVRGFIRARVTKNEFEYLFLDSFEKMYHLAEKVSERMELSGCTGLWKDSVEKGVLTHGDYNYHNILVNGDGMAVTNFEHMCVGVQAHDLYYFLRKAMEKYYWKQKTGQKLLEAYENVCPLSPVEREYVGLLLAYPEKYWKTASSYYHSNKAWLPQKNVEKLELAVRQEEEKRAFLESVFSLGI